MGGYTDYPTLDEVEDVTAFPRTRGHTLRKARQARDTRRFP
jgi:hypothetical protein